MAIYSYSIFVLFSISQIYAAPTDGPIRIELLTEKVSGLSEQAHQKFSTLSDTALQNAAAVNDLVSANLVTVGDYLTTGLTATTDVVKEQLDSASKFARQATSLVQDTASQGAKTIADGAATVMSQKSSILTTVLDQVRNIPSPIGIFSEPPRKLDTAVLEQEDFGSRLMSAKENIGTYFAGIFQPVPIVDTISEEEKYGNTGDKFETVGKALVSGSESIASFISNAAGVPVELVKQITRSASASLNNLGGRLIGLK